MKLLLLIVVSMMTMSAHAENLYQFDDTRQQAQFQHLLKELRCLVCQNQDLSDSNAPLAIDLKNEVYTMVKERQSDHEIIEFLTSRYGDFILFNPPFKEITYLLWLGPGIFLFFGLWLFKRAFVARRADA
tara:strand:- start:819 stop:1208 length:390 start_codon:yes stop_codon:yes gene_type:complete